MVGFRGRTEEFRQQGLQGVRPDLIRLERGVKLVGVHHAREKPGVKAARVIRPGDALRIHIGPYEYDVRVRALSARRGPAPQAALLYEESGPSTAARTELAARLAA